MYWSAMHHNLIHAQHHQHAPNPSPPPPKHCRRPAQHRKAPQHITPRPCKNHSRPRTLLAAACAVASDTAASLSMVRNVPGCPGTAMVDRLAALAGAPGLLLQLLRATEPTPAAPAPRFTVEADAQRARGCTIQAPPPVGEVAKLLPAWLALLVRPACCVARPLAVRPGGLQPIGMPGPQGHGAPRTSGKLLPLSGEMPLKATGLLPIMHWPALARSPACIPFTIPGDMWPAGCAELEWTPAHVARSGRDAAAMCGDDCTRADSRRCSAGCWPWLDAGDRAELGVAAPPAAAVVATPGPCCMNGEGPTRKPGGLAAAGRPAASALSEGVLPK